MILDILDPGTINYTIYLTIKPEKIIQFKKTIQTKAPLNLKQNTNYFNYLKKLWIKKKTLQSPKECLH